MTQRKPRARTRATYSLLILSLCCASQRARAWDDFGHMQVAAIAYGKLSALAKQRAAQLLERNPRYPNWTNGFDVNERARVAFVVAATWADTIKSDPAYKSDKQDAPSATQNIGYADLYRHTFWHYIDYPFSPDGTKSFQPSAPNVQTQIHLFISTLADPNSSEEIKSYDLTWLLHLVGDIHQPLHCTSRFDQADPHGDRGGNAVQIEGNEHPSVCDDPRYCWKPPSPVLHIFYDDILGDSCCVTESLEAAKRLPAADARAAAILDESAWAKESFELAQSEVYVAPIGVGRGPFAITPAYADRARKLAQKQIALAGARLAKVLNAAFAAERAAKSRPEQRQH